MRRIIDRMYIGYQPSDAISHWQSWVPGWVSGWVSDE